MNHQLNTGIAHLISDFVKENPQLQYTQTGQFFEIASPAGTGLRTALLKQIADHIDPRLFVGFYWSNDGQNIEVKNIDVYYETEMCPSVALNNFIIIERWELVNEATKTYLQQFPNLTIIAGKSLPRNTKV